MAKRNLNKFEQAGIIAAVIILALFVYNKKLYKPEVKKFVKTRKEWIKILGEVQTLKDDYGRQTLSIAIQQERKNLQQAKLELDKVRNVANYEKDLAGVLTTVNQIAAEYGLKIRDFSPTDESNLQITNRENRKDFYLKCSFYNLVMTGNFINLKSFLRELIHMPKQVNVANIAVERETEDESLKITLLLFI